MHSRGTLLEVASYAHAEYGGDVVGAVLAELADALARATADGVAPETIVLDPGLGFSKTPEQNKLLPTGRRAPLARSSNSGRPVSQAVCRHDGRPRQSERDRASATVCALAWERGARLFRVHDVVVAREALAIAHAVGGP